MSLFSRISDVVYLVGRSGRIAAAGDIKCAFQVKPLNPVVSMVKICSTTPPVLNLAFKKRRLLLHVSRRGKKGLFNIPSIGIYFLAVI